jgi:hypothetical protein
MTAQAVIVLVGVALAAWGHLIVHERRTAASVWRWLDDRFPVALRSETHLAGPTLLLVGALTAVMGMTGAARV